MSDKKLTPIQTAIEHYNRRTGNPTTDFIYGSIVDYLKSLLPTEKEFAREFFNDGNDLGGLVKFEDSFKPYEQ